MLVVFVRPTGEDRAEAVVPKELARRHGVEIALRDEGPFTSLADAPETPRLREHLARALDVPSVRRWRRARPWLLLGLFPVLALADLERQLVALGTTGVAARLVGDLVVLAFMVLEIARPIPRHPKTWALASLGIGARYAYMIAAMCGSALPLFWLGLTLASAACVLSFATMPSPRALERDVHAALEVPRISQKTLTPNAKPLVAAVMAALVLPAALFGARALGASVLAQGLVFVVVGGALPFAVRLPARPGARIAQGRPWLERVDAAACGFAAAIALTRLVHYTIIATSELLRCAAPHAYDAFARAFVDAQTAEITHHAISARTEAVLATAAVLVVPIIEERLYRATLQRALRERTTAAKAIAGASVIFGLAHLGVYRAAIYQTVLLGVAFGVAYEEAGLTAAIVAHTLYNAAQLM